MRMSRFLSGLVAAGLIGLVPVATPASAAESHSSGQASAAAPAVAERAKPRRDISINITPSAPFRVSGKVQPKYAGRFLTVQRRFEGQKKWSKFKTTKTTRRSTYRERVKPRSSVGRVYYRVKSRKTDQWAASYSTVVYIETCSGSCG